jgi:O-antigen/teichoic acid export membrane protein
MRELIKSFFSFGLATVIERVIAFLLLPIYTRYFTTAEFGVFDLITVVIGIVIIFAHLQLETSLQRYYFDYEGDEKNLFISTIVITMTILSVILTVILTLGATLISDLVLKNSQYSHLFKLAAVQIPFTNYSMLALVILRYEKKNKLFTIMIVAKMFVTVLFTLIFVAWLKMGLNGVFYAQLLGLIVSSILLFFSIRDFSTFKISNDLLKKAFAYAIPQFPARIGSVLLTYANRFFMVGYLTLSAIGIYSLSLKLASVLQIVYAAFVMAWAPFMFEQRKKDNHKEIFAKVLLLTASPLFLLVSIISIFSKELVYIAASPKFLTAHHYLGALCLYFALFIFKEIVDIGPKFTEKTKYLSYTFFLSVVVNFVSLYFSVKLYGVEGVVYSMLLTNAVLLVTSWIISNKLYYIPYNIWQFILMALPAFVLSILTMYMMPSLLVKMLILIVVTIYYGVACLKYFKLFKSSNSIYKV